MSGRTTFVAAFALAILLGGPLAIGATRDPVREGVRNPTGGAAERETQVIARTDRDTYGTRQSNLGAGGGAIYGCRSALDVQAIADPAKSTACIRANNLRAGKAFDFQSSRGRIVGIIQAGQSITTPKADSAPFVTNATGRAVGLNADRVDDLHANEIVAQAAAAAAQAVAGGGAGAGACPTGTILAGGGCLETAPRPAQAYAAAAATCGAAGRRLVPPDVLLSARTLGPIDLGAGEMSADLTAATLALAQGYATVSDAGAVSVATLGAASAFRCITR